MTDRKATYTRLSIGLLLLGWLATRRGRVSARLRLDALIEDHVEPWCDGSCFTISLLRWKLGKLA
ncbi:MAG TPA: hypothetical protein VGX68_13655 [Thermoanaerobaculia bacterium]|jgi:hypothetical protein|nr:hypothetical protein [Thermoanaerobaculia bacterium]